jgi:hypothetical protein
MTMTRSSTPLSSIEDKKKFIGAAASSLIPSIEAAALKLVAIANLNYAVHTPTYNRLIADAVVAMQILASAE